MEKILAVQTEIGVLSKTETNPFFKSKYLDINGLLKALIPLLAQNEVTVLQPLSNIDGKPALGTIVSVEGQVITENYIPLPEIQDPQKMGAVITYYRRYALQSMFLLQAEDDDANSVSGSKTGAITGGVRHGETTKIINLDDEI